MWLQDIKVSVLLEWHLLLEMLCIHDCCMVTRATVHMTCMLHSNGNMHITCMQHECYIVQQC